MLHELLQFRLVRPPRPVGTRGAPKQEHHKRATDGRCTAAVLLFDVSAANTTAGNVGRRRTANGVPNRGSCTLATRILWQQTLRLAAYVHMSQQVASTPRAPLTSTQPRLMRWQFTPAAAMRIPPRPSVAVWQCKPAAASAIGSQSGSVRRQPPRTCRLGHRLPVCSRPQQRFEAGRHLSTRS
eukprot:357056-Chlamydomonas_euryale.AAC.4